MRKWRPSFKSIYVIPEVRGNLESLEIILNRILPLRKFVNQEDKLIMLGGYIDGDQRSAQVVETLLTISDEYKDRCVFLRGDHEELMLRSISGTENDFLSWMQAGGLSTIESYAKKSGLNGPASSIPQSRLRDIIPPSHISFLKSLPAYHEEEDFFLFHGGFNPKIPLSDNGDNTFLFDVTSSKKYKQQWGKEDQIVVDKVMIGAHNYGSKEPIIFPKYFMLGGTAPKKLIVLDLNSMEACAAKRGKSRIYKTKIRTIE